nr:uncharacterized protein LOC111137161 isoform X2 [Crassostrea virginica]
MFVQDSWIYAALISLPEGDSIIIIMKSKTDGDITCNGNCTDTCQICDDNIIVFNRSKASIKPQLRMMVPGKPYILPDNHLEDFPQPDICLEYLFDDKMLAFRDCKETRPVQCMNDTGVFVTTACYQPSTVIPSCLPLPLEKNNHCNFTKDCTVAGLFQESNVYVVTLVGAAFIYGMINIIFIMCTVKYLLKKLTNRVSSQDKNSSPNRMEPKIQVYYTHL